MSDAPWTIRRVMDWTRGFFEEKKLDTPRLDGELLIGDALKLDRVRLYMDLDRPLNDRELTDIRARIKRRLAHEPVAYILGSRGFWTLDLQVDARVLIPRPDTERLVELAVKKLEGSPAPVICDVGTGSGAIALALASERPDAQVMATDASSDALEVARANAKALELERVTFLEASLLDGVDGPLDLVVSNPPYILSAVVDTLAPEVKDHEPRMALDGGADGFDVIRPLIVAAAERLRPGGRLMFEIGHDQGPAAKALVEADERFTEVAVHQDYGRNDRVVEATRT